MMINKETAAMRRQYYIRIISLDYGNDSFFVKKTNDSKKFLDKHGFPKELLLKE